MIRVRVHDERRLRRRRYEVERIPPGDPAGRWRKVRRAAVFDLEAVVGTVEAWALIQAAQRAWDDDRGAWTAWHEGSDDGWTPGHGIGAAPRVPRRSGPGPWSMLEVVEDAARRLGRETLLGSLRPGVPADDVRSALDACGLRSTADLETLYLWRDGTDAPDGATLGDISLFPGFHLLSVEEAVATYRSFSPDRRWPSALLPFLADGGGDFYGIDFSDPHRAPVRRFRTGEVEHPVEFASLGAMVETLATAYERGVFFVDDGGYLEMDDRVFGDLAGELDPEVTWWRP